MASVKYVSARSDGKSPEGQESFLSADFAKRMLPWAPRWKKRVTLSTKPLDYRTLPLADLVYSQGEPDPAEFKNGSTVLLFEREDCYELVRADFYTRLLVTEQRFIERQVDVGSVGVLSMAEALATRRDPTAAVWGAVGLPGVPLAVGVNASLRFADGVELLAHKAAVAQGQMGSTVGPPVSAGASVDPDKLDFGDLTLEALVSTAMETAGVRELRGVSQPKFTRRAAWLDSGRGHKPEVNYSGVLGSASVDVYRDAICRVHAGCVELGGHLTDSGELGLAARDQLARWGLNFQAWYLWL
jgi:hypothetical protein